LIASGRDADIFEFGERQVLRRSRDGRSLVAEARTMEFVRSHGYPAPEVFEISEDGCDLVMERIEGPTMVDMAATRPWRIRSLGKELARLHDSLHSLAAPSWLPAAPFGVGDRIVHMDLHPLNVLMGTDGPMVIDWTNAASGNSLADVALTWALIASGEVPTSRVRSVIIGIGRRLLLGAFLDSFQGDALRDMLVEAVDWKCMDANMTAVEISRMRSLL
jgi:aminoglycoside phosphotransferase (APT) family kinase protein